MGVSDRNKFYKNKELIHQERCRSIFSPFFFLSSREDSNECEGEVVVGVGFEPTNAEAGGFTVRIL